MYSVYLSILTVLPLLDGKGAIDLARLCGAVLTLDLFRVDKHLLYFWEETKHYWRMLTSSDEILTIRRLFSEQDQVYITPNIARRAADWLRSHPTLQLNFAVVKNPFLVNLQNGTFNIKTGELQEHRKADYMTTVLDAAYMKSPVDSGSESLLLREFCRKVFSSEEYQQKVQLLYQFIGYTISNVVGGKRALFIVGPANCGKSVIVNLMELIIGSAAVSRLSLINLADRFSTADLLGKTANLSSEIPVEAVPSKAFDVFKCLVGNDPIFAEKKGKDGFEFTFQGTLLFAGNVMPTFKSVDGTDALLSRMALLVFDKEVPKDQRDTDMVEKLFEERNLIVSRALDQMKRLVESNYNFAMGETEIAMLNEYKDSVNSVASFIQCVCRFEEDALTTKSEAYEYYKKYVELIGGEAEKRADFCKKMLVDPHITSGGKHRLNGQGPKSCFKGIKMDVKMYDLVYDYTQDTEMTYIGEKENHEE